MKTFTIGGTEYERVEIAVRGYERRQTSDVHDDNWLNVEVKICCGGFRGKFQTTFTTTEFSEFHSELSSLYHSNSGKAEFRTMEDQLALTVTDDGKGYVEVKGEASDQPGTGNRLTFVLQIDQSYLPASLKSLEAIVETFPYRG